jgi:hypothetical protein
VLSRKYSNSGRQVGNDVSTVEDTTLKETMLKFCKSSNKIFAAKVRSFVEHAFLYMDLEKPRLIV